ncbi:hypothetical protein Tdes44962_MAKER08022 [Teratosphaeria destructans]|uniref:Uncharacterized protein n=1 Tax=Teratosphaeria destructans TaxID=418781 RepID=A0A9W7W5H4_9PEZI|nr:hypothetical protein Tdes44962_MAKER08022 [Teratosphaeria destructans]
MSDLNKHESKQSLLSDPESQIEYSDINLERYQFRAKGARTWWICLEMLLLLTVFFATRAYYTNPSWNQRLAMADLYSPLYRDFGDFHIDQVLTGDDLWTNGSNIYRQDPSPAVDQVWDELGEVKYILVTEEEAIKMGKPTEYAVRWPDEPDKFLMHLHAPHLLHCLNVLRKNAYHNFPHYYKDGETLNAIHWTHWSHCLEIVRQELSCRPSMHLISMVWQEGEDVFFPDFHTQKKCVRWDDFQEMTSRRMIPHKEVVRVTKNTSKPKDAVQRPTPPEGWEVHNRNREWMAKMVEKGYTFKSGGR